MNSEPKCADCGQPLGLAYYQGVPNAGDICIGCHAVRFPVRGVSTMDAGVAEVEPPLSVDDTLKANERMRQALAAMVTWSGSGVPRYVTANGIPMGMPEDVRAVVTKCRDDLLALVDEVIERNEAVHRCPICDGPMLKELRVHPECARNADCNSKPCCNPDCGGEWGANCPHCHRYDHRCEETP